MAAVSLCSWNWLMSQQHMQKKKKINPCWVLILPYIFWSSCNLSIIKACGCNSCNIMWMWNLSEEICNFLLHRLFWSLPTFLYGGRFTTHGLIKVPLYLFLSYPVKRTFSFCALGWGFCCSFFHALWTGSCYCVSARLRKFCLLIFLFTVLE